MSRTIPSTRSLLDLLNLFEQSNSCSLDSNGIRLQGVPGSCIESSSSLELNAVKSWMSRVGYLAEIEVPCADGTAFVELEATEDPGIYDYRCPESFQRKQVSADRVAVFDVDSVKLLNLLADLLNIPRMKQSGIQAARIERKLWQLGSARIGPVIVPVWLARGMDVNVEEVFQSLLDTRLPEQGLILCHGRELPRSIRPPRNYRVAYLHDALIDYSPTPCMDVHYLERVLTSDEDGIRPSALPVDFANGVLRIRTMSEVWVIKGEKQSKAVAYMYEQAQYGRWVLDASEILAAAYPELRTEEERTGLKMQDLFKSSVWRKFIDNPAKGKYAFKLS